MGQNKKFLEYAVVRELLNKKAGKQAVDVVKLCVNNKYSNDEKIANKLKTKVTEIRTILNRLHYHGLAQYSKTRNKKTGWYSYTWKINEKRIIELVINEAKQEKEMIHAQSKQIKEYTLFNCKKNCGELPFEIAMQYSFQCPQCGGPMTAIDEKKRLKELDKRAQKLQEIIDIFEKKL